MLLSSVAERVYWLGRYVERAEDTARMILVNTNLLLDLPRSCDVGWFPLVAITGNAESFRRAYQEASERNVIRFLVTDSTNNASCILASISNARETLRTSRAIFPKPVWEVLNDLHIHVKEHGGSALNRKGRYAFMRHIIDCCHLIQGKLWASMSYDEVFEFVRMGLNLERADMTSRIIDVRSDTLLAKRDGILQPFDDIRWKSVLDSLAAYHTYRRYVHVRVAGPEVLRYLLQDRYFPRSIHFCLAQLEQSLDMLAASAAPRFAVMKARRKVRNTDVLNLIDGDLHGYLDRLQLDFMEINDALHSAYFEGRDIPMALRPVEPMRMAIA